MAPHDVAEMCCANDDSAGSDKSLVHIQMLVVSDPISGVKEVASSTSLVHGHLSSTG